MRGDRGVENATVAGIQRFLRRSKSHQNCSFLSRKSIANQRIETWWSYLQKVFLQRWINYFKDLIDEGLFDPSDKDCLRVVMEFWMSCISYKTDTEKRKGDMKLEMLTYCCHVSSSVNLHTMDVQMNLLNLHVS